MPHSGLKCSGGSSIYCIARSGNGVVLALVTWFMAGKSDMGSVTWVWTGCGSVLIVLSVVFHVRRPKTGA